MSKKTPKSNPIFSMSDEAFLEMGGTSAAQNEEEDPDDEENQEEDDGDSEASDDTGDESGENGDEDEGESSDKEGSSESDDNDPNEEGEEGEPGDLEAEADKDDKSGKQADKKTTNKTPAKGAQEDPKDPAVGKTFTATEALDGYKKVMAPFKANGKVIEPRNIDEVVSLMQMGANYTQKMQAIQPHRKALTMLQNHGLLDEAKLSLLIDIEKGDVQALKKLIKDKGIDTNEIDFGEDSNYEAGRNIVSDEEATFRGVVEDLKTTTEGRQTITTANGWDKASKDLLWKNPEALQVIHDQRQSGLYELIAEEVDRRKTLNKIPVTQPFLTAYQAVGSEMHQSGELQRLAVEKGLVSQEELDRSQTPKDDKSKDKVDAKEVVAKLVRKPKPTVSNGSKVNGAVSTKTSSKAAKVVVNPLSMDDDSFLKQFEGRV